MLKLRLARATTAVVALSILSACGYQVVGSKIAAEPFELSCDKSRYRTLCETLSHASTADEQRESRNEQVIKKVTIKEPKCSARIISLRADASPAESELRCYAAVMISGQTDSPIEFKEQVSRSFINNENSVLAKEKESSALKEALWETLGEAILERIVHAGGSDPKSGRDVQ